MMKKKTVFMAFLAICLSASIFARRGQKIEFERVYQVENHSDENVHVFIKWLLLEGADWPCKDTDVTLKPHTTSSGWLTAHCRAPYIEIHWLDSGIYKKYEPSINYSFKLIIENNGRYKIENLKK